MFFEIFLIQKSVKIFDFVKLKTFLFQSIKGVSFSLVDNLTAINNILRFEVPYKVV